MKPMDQDEIVIPINSNNNINNNSNISKSVRSPPLPAATTPGVSHRHPEYYNNDMVMHHEQKSMVVPRVRRCSYSQIDFVDPPYDVASTTPPPPPHSTSKTENRGLTVHETFFKVKSRIFRTNCQMTNEWLFALILLSPTKTVSPYIEDSSFVFFHLLKPSSRLSKIRSSPIFRILFGIYFIISKLFDP